jgi:hypothetical protein
MVESEVVTMKALYQQLQEKVAVLRARGKGEAVEAILAEASEYSIEAQLGKLAQFERSLSPNSEPVRKNNGASDNGRHQESFNESADSKSEEASKKALVESWIAMGFSRSEAEFMSTDNPESPEQKFMREAIEKG